ncbi:MAG: hypothetical protein ACXV5Q_12595 [Frankiaceae bacterium]
MNARRVGQVMLTLAAGYLFVLVATRRYHQHWGASDAEIARSLPGDDLIPASKLDSTHAITVHAPADRIWPWLAQVGYGGRAGFYSYDVLERRFGARDINRLRPDMPAPVVGDTLPFAPGMPMTVAVVDPPRALVLWQVFSANKAIDPTRPWGADHVAWRWAFVLERIDVGTTRLLTRMRVDYQPAVKWVACAHLLLEPAHFIMGRRQLLGLRQRAEAANQAAIVLGFRE